ncbi:hypothetical protein JCM8097_002841 [Rhodosporidiobolus ruineniae]
MPSSPSRPSKPAPLPSLLQHLRTTSTASTASISLSTDTVTAQTRPDTSPIQPPPAAGPSRSPSHLDLADSASLHSFNPSSSRLNHPRTRTLSSPLRPQHAPPPDNPLPTTSDSSSSSSSASSSAAEDEEEGAHSDSSFEGLAQRLKEAREGKGRGLVLPDGGEGEQPKKRDKGKGKERALEPEQERPDRSRADSYSLSVGAASPAADDGSPTAPLAAPEPAEGEEEDDEGDDDDASSLAFDLPSRFEGQPDPRDMLRAQLGSSSAAGQQEEGRRDGAKRVLLHAVSGGEGEREKETEKGGEVLYQPRRYFVLSTAGKLVWTSDQAEEAATGLVGVMQAIVSIFADEGDKIRYVQAGPTRIAFLLKPPLYLVVVSNGWGEPESVLRSHLDHLYLQVLSVVTLAQLQALFQRRSNADLRQLLAGTEPFFSTLTTSLQSSALALQVLTSSIEVYRVEPKVRDRVAECLSGEVGREVVRDLDLLYVLVLAHGRLVTLLRPKKHSIHPTDLHLLLSTIYSTSPTPSPAAPSDSPTALSPAPSPALDPSAAPLTTDQPPKKPPRRRTAPLTSPSSESWFPICLPRFNPRGFLYAYVSFFPSSSSVSTSTAAEEAEERDGGVGVVVLSSRRDAFDGVKSAAGRVKAKLLASSSTGESGRKRTKSAGAGTGTGTGDGGLVHELEMARVGQEYSLGELAIPGLRHFVYKSRALVQVTRPAWEGEYREEDSEGRCRLVTLYRTVHEALHPRLAQAGAPAKPPAQVQYVRTEHEAVLGWVTPTFELYIATTPLLPHSAVVSAARAVSKWVAKEEARLFLMGAPSF